jgi:hypothetical protein
MAVGALDGIILGEIVGMNVGFIVGKQVSNIDGACVGKAMLVQGQNRR